MILEEILRVKREEIGAAQQRLPFDELQRRVHTQQRQPRFRDPLLTSDKPIALIAELKRKSPSRGMLRERFDPVSLAQELQDAGASALSVLTDEQFFGGSLDILRTVQQFVDIPVLRKDFIIDPYQIYEAAQARADAVLLIARILSDETLRQFLEDARRLQLDALVEVHSELELERAVRAGAELIGINQRDLDTLHMHPNLTAKLVPKIPRDTTIVAESGIHTTEDLTRLQGAGVRAVLIGESLMTAPDVSAKIRELFAGIWPAC